MSSITTILGTDTITASRSTINTNFSNLNSTKKEDSMSTNKLLWRGTASTGVIEEITLGTNLSMTGTTLNASWGGGITIWTTAITSGTSGRILYDNAGVVGELATNGTGNVSLTTSPTFVTPLLGTPTSWTLTNCTGTATWLTSWITNALKSATTTVDVSAATAPSNWQVLTATSSTTATWQTPSGWWSSNIFQIRSIL